MKRPSNDDDQDGPPQKKTTAVQSSRPQPCQPGRIQDVSPHESGSAPRANGFQSGQRAPSRQSSASSSSGTPLPLPIPKGKSINTARRTGGAPSRPQPSAVAPVDPQAAGTPTPPTTPIVESTEKLRGVLEKIRAIQPPSTAAPTTGENSSTGTTLNNGDAPPPPPSTQSSSIIARTENEPNADENSPSGKRLIVKLPLPFAQTPPGKDVVLTSPQNSTHDQPLPNGTSIIPLPEKTLPLAISFPSDVARQPSPSDDDEIENRTEELPDCRPGLIPSLPTRSVCQMDPDKYCTEAYRKLAMVTDKAAQDVVKAVSNVLKRRDEAFQEYILKLEQENENQINLLKQRDENHASLTAEVEDVKQRLQETMKAQSQVEKEAEKLRATAEQIGERMSKLKAEGEEKDKKVQSLHTRLAILEKEVKAVTEERDKFKRYYTRHKEIDSELGL